MESVLRHPPVCDSRHAAVAAPIPSPRRASAAAHSLFVAFVAFAALHAPGAALAGAGQISTVVTPLTAAVTYSVAASLAPARPALDTYIGYVVNVSNNGGNTINGVRFTGRAVATDADEKAIFSSVEGATCSVSTDQTAIECAIGQLRAGQSAPSFAVFFKAPIKDTLTPLPNGDATNCSATDCVLFSGITYYAEGTGGLLTSPPQNSAVSWAASAVTLGTFSPTLVKSSLQKSGGDLFTGSGGISSRDDPFTTSVKVPASASYTTAEILESPDSINCTNNFTACFRSDITIPGTFSPYLTIVLRQDASTILKRTKIESVLVQYTGINGTVFVGDCANATTPRSDGIPCIARRVDYRKRTAPGWTPELDGDFEWTLINTGNGSYKVF